MSNIDTCRPRSTRVDADADVLSALLAAYPHAATAGTIGEAMGLLAPDTELNLTVTRIPNGPGAELMVPVITYALHHAAMYTQSELGEPVTGVGLVVHDRVNIARSVLVVLPDVSVAGANLDLDRVEVVLPSGAVIELDTDLIVGLAL